MPPSSSFPFRISSSSQCSFPLAYKFLPQHFSPRSQLHLRFLMHLFTPFCFVCYGSGAHLDFFLLSPLVNQYVIFFPPSCCFLRRAFRTPLFYFAVDGCFFFFPIPHDIRHISEPLDRTFMFSRYVIISTLRPLHPSLPIDVISSQDLFWYKTFPPILPPLSRLHIPHFLFSLSAACIMFVSSPLI